MVQILTMGWVMPLKKAWVDEQNMNVALRYAKKDGLTAIILH